MVSISHGSSTCMVAIVLASVVISGVHGKDRGNVPPGFQGGVNPEFRRDPSIPPEYQRRGPPGGGGGEKLYEGYKPPSGLGFRANMPGLATSGGLDLIPRNPSEAIAVDEEDVKEHFGNPEEQAPEIPAEWGLDQYINILATLDGSVVPDHIELSEKRANGVLDAFDNLLAVSQAFRSRDIELQRRSHDEKLRDAFQFRNIFAKAAWKERQRLGTTPLEVFLGYIAATLNRLDDRDKLEVLSSVKLNNSMMPTEWKLKVVQFIVDANKTQRKAMTQYKTEEEFGTFAGSQMSAFLDSFLGLLHNFRPPSKAEEATTPTRDPKQVPGSGVGQNQPPGGAQGGVPGGRQGGGQGGSVGQRGAQGRGAGYRGSAPGGAGGRGYHRPVYPRGGGGGPRGGNAGGPRGPYYAGRRGQYGGGAPGVQQGAGGGAAPPPGKKLVKIKKRKEKTEL